METLLFLGRTSDFTMSDKHAIAEFVTDFFPGPKLMTSLLIKEYIRCGSYKIWLCWPLLMYEVSISVDNH